MEEETVPSLTRSNFAVGEVTAVLSSSSHWQQQNQMENPNLIIQNIKRKQKNLQTILSYLAQTAVFHAAFI